MSQLSNDVPLEEKRKVRANLGPSLPGKVNGMDHKLIFNQQNTVLVLTAAELKPNETLYLKNISDSSITVDTTCTKIFVESCKNLTVTFNQTILTHCLEIWKCEALIANINTSILTLQVDLCKDTKFTFAQTSFYDRCVWSAVDLLDIAFLDSPEFNLKTSSQKMLEQNPTINTATDQFMARILTNKVTNKKQMVNELIVRLENGFPTTEREARKFDERQEANMQKLAAEILGKDITIKPKPTGPKIARNDPCICGSTKKFKKCCGAELA